MKKFSAVIMTMLFLLLFASCKKDADINQSTATKSGTTSSHITSQTDGTDATIANVDPSQTSGEYSQYDYFADLPEKPTMPSTNVLQQNNVPVPPPPPKRDDNAAQGQNQLNDASYTIEMSNLSLEYSNRKRQIESTYNDERISNRSKITASKNQIAQQESRIQTLRNQKTNVKSQYDRELGQAYANSGGQESSYVRTVKQKYEAQLNEIDNQIAACEASIFAEQKNISDYSDQKAQEKYNSSISELEQWNTAEKNKINRKYGK